MHVRASVRRATGNTRHVIHGAESNDITSQIACVEIEEAEGGFHVLYLDERGECVAHTWHQTEEQAKAQARFELEVEDADWQDVLSTPRVDASPRRDDRTRDIHLLDDEGMVACNPRDREAAHRADVGDIATTTERAGVTCKRCRAIAERSRR